MPAKPEFRGYCTSCGYDLRALPIARCPECGRAYDPRDGRTFRRTAGRAWGAALRWYGIRLFFVVSTIVLIALSLWGWLWWGWKEEQQALASLHMDAAYQPIVPPWLRKRLGPSGYVCNRAVSITSPADPHRWVQYDRVTDISPIAKLTYLTNLNGLNHNISDLSPLSRLSALRRFELRGHPAVRSTALLTKLEALEELDLAYTEIRDLGALRSLRGLRTLYLEGTPIRDGELVHLGGLSSLVELRLGATRITRLDALVSLSALEELRLEDTAVVDIAPLAKLPRLRVLFAGRTQITDVSPLATIKTLQALSLNNTRVGDVKALQDCRELAFVDLSYTAISDMSPLVACTKMREMCLRGVPIADWTFITRMAGLRKLEVLRSAFNEEKIAKLRSSLPSCEIHLAEE